MKASRSLRLAVALLLSLAPVLPSMAAETKLQQISVQDINGKPTNLGAYAGKVLLVVNVASKCGNTKQYTALEALYQKYKDQGLVVLGFPANNFGGQEPGTEQEILQFCTSKYNVTFPMFSKISVKGPDQHPLYKELTTSSDAKTHEVKWNFGKFLIGKDGKVLAQFEPGVKPDNEAVVSAIESALAAK